MRDRRCKNKGFHQSPACAKASAGRQVIIPYLAAAAISLSIGAPTRLPHSVHEPS